MTDPKAIDLLMRTRALLQETEALLEHHLGIQSTRKPDGTMIPPEFRDLAELRIHVALDHGVTCDQFMYKSNAKVFVNARRDFALRARKAGYSFSVIARFLKKHHTTVISMVNRDAT